MIPFHSLSSPASGPQHCSVLLAPSAAGRTRLVSDNWQTVCATLRLLNTSQPELINFWILLSPIACDITISLGLVQYCIDFIVFYWLLFQSSHWLLYQINHLPFVTLLKQWNNQLFIILAFLGVNYAFRSTDDRPSDLQDWAAKKRKKHHHAAFYKAGSANRLITTLLTFIHGDVAAGGWEVCQRRIAVHQRGAQLELSHAWRPGRHRVTMHRRRRQRNSLITTRQRPLQTYTRHRLSRFDDWNKGKGLDTTWVWPASILSNLMSNSRSPSIYSKYARKSTC